MKHWPLTSEKLEKAMGKFDYEFTNAAGVATLLANDAVKEGYEKIISVGGDGTLHEVVQGLFDEGSLINTDIILGTIPSGSGTDFARVLKISHDTDEAIVRLRGDKVRKIDIGRAVLKDHMGNTGKRFFINMADVGLGGEVAERVNNSHKIFGGFATYLYSSVISFASYKPKTVKIQADAESFEMNVTSIFIANGQYFGGGMWLAPKALLDDGFFDVVIVGELSKWHILTFTPHLYSGKLLTQPGVKFLKAKKIAIESEEDVLINLDGEQPGTTPVEFTLLPNALNFKV